MHTAAIGLAGKGSCTQGLSSILASLLPYSTPQTQNADYDGLAGQGSGIQCLSSILSRHIPLSLRPSCCVLPPNIKDVLQHCIIFWDRQAEGAPSAARHLQGARQAWVDVSGGVGVWQRVQGQVGTCREAVRGVHTATAAALRHPLQGPCRHLTPWARLTLTVCYRAHDQQATLK